MRPSNKDFSFCFKTLLFNIRKSNTKLDGLVDIFCGSEQKMNWAVLLPLEHGIIAMSILRFCCCVELNASWIVDQQTCET